MAVARRPLLAHILGYGGRDCLGVFGCLGMVEMVPLVCIQTTVVHV
jgi:hypothetical protein